MYNLVADKLFLRYYLAFTLVVALVHFGLLFVRYHIHWIPSLVDAMVSVLLLNVLLLSLWYVVRYARSDSLTSLTSFRNSVLAGVFLVSLWLILSKVMLENLFQAHPLYLDFFQQSLALRFVAGILLASMVYMSFFLTLYRQSVEEARERENQLRLMVQKTELQALKNQLNPHFIYNSLNSISSLTLYSPDKAREMVSLLSDFLRIALRQDAMQKVSLQKEMENVELYLQIEKVRFEEKLNWEFHIPEECLQCQLPVMILQPLVENAVKHGIQYSAQTSALIIKAELQGNQLWVGVENSFDPGFHKFKGEGVGLENVRNRMKLIYGKSGLVKPQLEGAVFKVNMYFPQ